MVKYLHSFHNYVAQLAYTLTVWPLLDFIALELSELRINLTLMKKQNLEKKSLATVSAMTLSF